MSDLRIPPSPKALLSGPVRKPAAATAGPAAGIAPAPSTYQAPVRPRLTLAPESGAPLAATAALLRVGSGGTLTAAPKTQLGGAPQGSELVSAGSRLLRPPPAGVRIGSAADLLGGALPAGLETGLGSAATRPGVQSAAAAGPAYPAADEAALAEVQHAREAAEAANQQKAQLDQQLAATLASVGPGLTEDQQQQLTEAFWAEPEHQAVVDQANAAADELSRQLAQNGPTLEQAAQDPAGGNRYGEELGRSYADLATSPEHAQEAIDFAGRIADQPALLRGVGQGTEADGEQWLADHVAAPALQAAQEEVLSRHPNTPEGVQQALAELQAIAEPLKSVKGLADQIGALGEALHDLSTGKYREAAAVFGSFDEATPFGKACQAFTLAAGLYAGVSAGLSGDGEAAFREFLSAGKSGLEVTASVLKTLGHSQAAKEAARFAEELAPFLSLVVDAEQVASDLQSLTSGDANAGTWVKTIGDLTAALGDALGPGLGTVVTAVGDIISTVGSFIEQSLNEDRDRQQVHDERLALLQSIGLDDTTAGILASAGQLGAQLGTLGISPELFINELARAEQEIANGPPWAADAVRDGYEVAALYGVTGAGAIELAHAVTEAALADPSVVDQLHDSFATQIEEAYAHHDDYDPSGATAEYRAFTDQLIALLGPEVGPAVAEQFALYDRKPSDINADFFLVRKTFADVPGHN